VGNIFQKKKKYVLKKELFHKANAQQEQRRERCLQKNFKEDFYTKIVTTQMTAPSST
jgi:hypothetical protein